MTFPGICLSEIYFKLDFWWDFDVTISEMQKYINLFIDAQMQVQGLICTGRFGLVSGVPDWGFSSKCNERIGNRVFTISK